MTQTEMKNRTKEYANRILKVCEALPNNWVARTLGRQFLRCGTSVGSNYRAVCRAKSTRLQRLMQEGNEILAIVVAAVKTTRVASNRRLPV